MKFYVVALCLGLLGSIFIWIVAPLNLFLLNNGLISDSYFPEIAVFVMLILILGLNPLLQLVSKGKLFISRRQLALIFAMLLLAATIPTQGLLRMLPFSLARTTQDTARSLQLAEIHQEMNLAPSLFPDRIAYGVDTPNSTAFLEELPAGASIPWRAWIPPLLSWGALLIGIWMLMIGLGMIVYPQWRNNERLPFPILTIQHSLIGDITPKKRIPGLFKDKLFWLSAGMVLFLYSLNGLSASTEGSWPTFPLGWNLNNALSEDPWRHLPWNVRVVNKLYFMLIGIAYFMPNRISFSIWFTTIAYGIHQMLTVTYAPPFDTSMVKHHRHGATFAVGLMVLYLGRQHWARVVRNMFRPVITDEDKLNRRAGWIFTMGWMIMIAWLVWVGISPGWAWVLVFFCFLSALVISRILAESGMSFISLTAMEPSWLVGLLPAGLLSPVMMYISGFLNIFFIDASRISVTAMMTHAMGVDEEADPKQQRRLPAILIPLLILGLLVGGATYLIYSYNNFSSLDGRLLTSANFGTSRLAGIHNNLLAFSRGAHNPVSLPEAGQVAFGGLLALVLMLGCLASSAWPLHPIGMLMAGAFYANVGWASIFVGWGVKLLVLRYGGAGLYKRLKNLFMGLILGELFAAVLWAIVPVIQILLGVDPAAIGRIMVLPT